MFFLCSHCWSWIWSSNVIVGIKTVCTWTKQHGGGDYVANDASSLSWHLNPLVCERGCSLVPFAFCLIGLLLPVEGQIMFESLTFTDVVYLQRKTKVILSLWLNSQDNDCCHNSNKNDAEHTGNNCACDETRKSSCENVLHAL